MSRGPCRLRNAASCSPHVFGTKSVRILFAHENYTLKGDTMSRYLLLWVIGVPIPILLLIWLFGGLN
jgi:hypothetical protein